DGGNVDAERRARDPVTPVVPRVDVVWWPIDPLAFEADFERAAAFWPDAQRDVVRAIDPGASTVVRTVDVVRDQRQREAVERTRGVADRERAQLIGVRVVGIGALHAETERGEVPATERETPRE